MPSDSKAFAKSPIVFIRRTVLVPAPKSVASAARQIGRVRTKNYPRAVVVNSLFNFLTLLYLISFHLTAPESHFVRGEQNSKKKALFLVVIKVSR